MEGNNEIFSKTRYASFAEAMTDNKQLLITKDWERPSSVLLSCNENDGIKSRGEEYNLNLPLCEEELEYSELWKEMNEKTNQQHSKGPSLSTYYNESFSGRISPIQSQDIFSVVNDMNKSVVWERDGKEMEPMLENMEDITRYVPEVRKFCLHEASSPCGLCNSNTKCSLDIFGNNIIQKKPRKLSVFSESYDNKYAVKHDVSNSVEESFAEMTGDNGIEEKTSSNTMKMFSNLNKKGIDSPYLYQQTKVLNSHTNAMRSYECQGMAEKDFKSKELFKVQGIETLHHIHSEELKNRFPASDTNQSITSTQTRELLPSFWWLKDKGKSGNEGFIHDLANNLTMGIEEPVRNSAGESGSIKKLNIHNLNQEENTDQGTCYMPNNQNDESSTLKKVTSYGKGLVNIINPCCKDSKQRNTMWDKSDFDVERAWWKNVKRVNLPNSPYGTKQKTFEMAVKHVLWNMDKINDHTYRRRNDLPENATGFEFSQGVNTFPTTDVGCKLLKDLKTDERKKMQELKEGEMKVIDVEMESLSKDGKAIRTNNDRKTESLKCANDNYINVEQEVVTRKDSEEMEWEPSQTKQLKRTYVDDRTKMECKFGHETAAEKNARELVEPKDNKQNKIRKQNFGDGTKNKGAEIDYILMDPNHKIMEKIKEELKNEENVKEKIRIKAGDQDKEAKRGEMIFTIAKETMLSQEIDRLADQMVDVKEMILENGEGKLNINVMEEEKRHDVIITKNVNENIFEIDNKMTDLETDGKKVHTAIKNMTEREDSIDGNDVELLKANSSSKDFHQFTNTKFCSDEKVPDINIFAGKKVRECLENGNIEREANANEISKKEQRTEGYSYEEERAFDRNELSLQEERKSEETEFISRKKNEQNYEKELYEEVNSGVGKIKGEEIDTKEVAADKMTEEINKNEAKSKEKYEEETTKRCIICLEKNVEEPEKKEVCDYLIFNEKNNLEGINDDEERSIENSIQTQQDMNKTEYNLQRDAILEDNIKASVDVKKTCKNISEKENKQEERGGIGDLKYVEIVNQPESSIKQNELERNIVSSILDREKKKILYEHNSILSEGGFVDAFKMSNKIELFKGGKTLYTNDPQTKNLIVSPAFSEVEVFCSKDPSYPSDSYLTEFGGCSFSSSDEMNLNNEKSVAFVEKQITEVGLPSSNAGGNISSLIVQLLPQNVGNTQIFGEIAFNVNSDIFDFNKTLQLGEYSKTTNPKIQFQFNSKGLKINKVLQKIVLFDAKKCLYESVGVNIHAHEAESINFKLDEVIKEDRFHDYNRRVDNYGTPESIRELAVFDASVQNEKVVDNDEEKMGLLNFSNIFGWDNIFKKNDVNITFIQVNLIKTRWNEISHLLNDKIFLTYGIERNKLLSKPENEKGDTSCDEEIGKVANQTASLYDAKVDDTMPQNSEICDENTHKWIFDLDEVSAINCELNQPVKINEGETKNHEIIEKWLFDEEGHTCAFEEFTIDGNANIPQNVSQCKQIFGNNESQIETVSELDEIVPSLEENLLRKSNDYMTNVSVFKISDESHWEEHFKYIKPALSKCKDSQISQEFTESSKISDKKEKLENTPNEKKSILSTNMTFIEGLNFIENQIYPFGDECTPNEKLLEASGCIIEQSEKNILDEDINHDKSLAVVVMPETLEKEPPVVNNNRKNFLLPFTNRLTGVKVAESIEETIKNKSDGDDDPADTFSLDEYLETIIDKHCRPENKTNHLVLNSSPNAQTLFTNVECQTQLSGITNMFHTSTCVETLLLSGYELQICQRNCGKRNLQALNLEMASNKRFKKIDVDDSHKIYHKNGECNDFLPRKRSWSSAFFSDDQNEMDSSMYRVKEMTAEKEKDKSLQFEEDEANDQLVEKESIDQKVPDVTQQDYFEVGRTLEKRTNTKSDQLTDANAREVPSILNPRRSTTVLRLGLSKRAKLPRLHPVK